MSGFGLEEIGIPGRDYLKEALTSCTDPLKAIEDFQIENGILLPSLRPMLPLLDLHGIKRQDFHNSVLEDLREKLIGQIEVLAASTSTPPKEKERKLKELLNKSFPVIKIKQLRPVVMCVLKHLSFIDDKFLKVLVRDKELYQDCDIVIKRHLWRDNQSLFGDEVSPHLSQYIKEKEAILYSNEGAASISASLSLTASSSGATTSTPTATSILHGFFSVSPKSRRGGTVIQKLADMIGSNVKLYDMTLQFLRTLFLRTRNVHYCTLRSELLMALHDREVQDIIGVDPCHKFTWCLDACIREKNVDGKRSRELQGFLDAIRRGQEQVLGDLSMTLCDPFAINFLATAAMKVMNAQVGNEAMPRDNAVLHLLLRMLGLGLSAWDMIDTQEFMEPKVDPHLVTKFIPALMSLIVDDQVRSLNAKLPEEERETASIVIDHSGPPPDAFQHFCEENTVAATLAMHYTLQASRGKDRTAIMRVLGILANSVKSHPFEDVFLHCFITDLIKMKDDFEAEDFCTVVFDEFFFTLISGSAGGGGGGGGGAAPGAVDNVVRHLLRLLWYVYSKISPSRMESCMKLTEPAAAGAASAGSSGLGGHSSIGMLSVSSSSSGAGTTADHLAKMHQDLKEKVEAHREALASAAASAAEGKSDPFI